MDKKPRFSYSLFFVFACILFSLLIVSGCGKKSIETMPAPRVSANWSVPMKAKAMHGMDYTTEEYHRVVETGFKNVTENPLSTFSIDVDTASYSNVRRFLMRRNTLPPRDAVRIEELINYFTYDYPEPTGEHPFSISTEMSTCPWNSENRLVHMGLQGKRPDYENLKPCNLVFLIDSSGSMSTDNKLPLMKKSLHLLLDELGSNDRIAIVAYAGSAGLILPSTPASNKKAILSALDCFQPFLSCHKYY